MLVKKTRGTHIVMKLQIQLFAGLVDLLGTPELEVNLEQESITAGELKELLMRQFPHASKTLSSCFFALNQAYADDEATLTPTDEIALIPPVSGGQGDAGLLPLLEDDLY